MLALGLERLGWRTILTSPLFRPRPALVPAPSPTCGLRSPRLAGWVPSVGPSRGLRRANSGIGGIGGIVCHLENKTSRVVQPCLCHLLPSTCADQLACAALLHSTCAQSAGVVALSSACARSTSLSHAKPRARPLTTRCAVHALLVGAVSVDLLQQSQGSKLARRGKGGSRAPVNVTQQAPTNKTLLFFFR